MIDDADLQADDVVWLQKGADGCFRSVPVQVVPQRQIEFETRFGGFHTDLARAYIGPRRQACPAVGEALGAEDDGVGRLSDDGVALRLRPNIESYLCLRTVRGTTSVLAARMITIDEELEVVGTEEVGWVASCVLVDVNVVGATVFTVTTLRPSSCRISVTS